MGRSRGWEDASKWEGAGDRRMQVSEEEQEMGRMQVSGKQVSGKEQGIGGCM